MDNTRETFEKKKKKILPRNEDFKKTSVYKGVNDCIAHCLNMIFRYQTSKYL